MSKVINGVAKAIEILPFSSFRMEYYGSLSAAHHFSFGKYYDSKRIRHGLLRLFDDGLFRTQQGIPLHPHRNIDIISVVLHKNHHPFTNKIEGGASLVHRDTGGGSDTIPPGSAQVMSLGHEGVSHSENITNGDSANVFQIWINQTKKKNDNSYRKVSIQPTKNKFTVLASGFPADINSTNAKLQSESRILSAMIEPGQKLKYNFSDEQRLGYLVPASGKILLNGIEVMAHDAAKISNTPVLEVEVLGDDTSELVLIDVPYK